MCLYQPEKLAYNNINLHFKENLYNTKMVLLCQKEPNRSITRFVKLDNYDFKIKLNLKLLIAIIEIFI